MQSAVEYRGRYSQICDHIFIHTEELAISYVSLDDTYAERVDTFRKWIQGIQGKVGFEVVCEWCTATRSNALLRTLKKEVEKANLQVANLITEVGFPMAVAVKHTILKDVFRSCCLDMKVSLCIFSITGQPSCGPCMVLSFFTRASPKVP